MSWFPDPPDGIVHVIERETPQVVEFYTDTPNIVSYDYTIDPAPPGGMMSITPSASGVTVSISLLSGNFPIQFIDYVDADNVQHRVTSWDEWDALPPGEPRWIVSFRPDETITKYSFDFEVIAVDNLAAVHTNSWKIDLDNDWRDERAMFLGELYASA